ncbi:hypothetical protein [Candidatus Palauibacter sp.]|uniref:hypothetical protein n=1 Tax=Candidatus Palauibacter sp. TaxID=3101350 RepID=UPI003B516FC9
MGLHPDIHPQFATLLLDASERTQLVVTTHADILVDALTDTPETIVVCEKIDGCTRLERLSPEVPRDSGRGRTSIASGRRGYAEKSAGPAGGP